MATTWHLRSRSYDLFEASNFRRGIHKAELFGEVSGRLLLVAVGTGVDIKHLPSSCEVVGIDISQEMLRRACPRQKCYCGSLALVQADALDLCFPDASFDTAVTSCTMCSVPDPVRALRELYRVLRPGGLLLMFEHVRSRNAVLGLALDAMSVFTRRNGTDMSRDTVSNVRAADFRITRIKSVFLDIILSIHALKPEENETCISQETLSERRAI